MKKVEVRLSSHKYEINIGSSLLEGCGEWARGCLAGNAGKIAIISNSKVYGLYGDPALKSLQKAGFEASFFLIGDGERFKNLKTLEKTLDFLSSQKIGRADAIIALGGGVVGDLAGFAAAIYLRGIPFLQIPTTLLAQIDSSVGGKTGVNTPFGKNLIGAFHQPMGVLIDPKTLTTLPARELKAGFCEAIKHGAISGEGLFGKTADFLRKNPPESINKGFAAYPELEELLAMQVGFKAGIVSNDEKEDISRIDPRSRKILNFGHTIGHALERITNYRHFKHGEAIGYGMMAAAEISKKLDLLDVNSVSLLNDVLHCLGTLPETKNIDIEKLIESILFDKKAVGKSIQWVLLEAIGRPQIVDSSKIPAQLIKESLQKILAK